jgi:hypothetical protein
MDSVIDSFDAAALSERTRPFDGTVAEPERRGPMRTVSPALVGLHLIFIVIAMPA